MIARADMTDIATWPFRLAGTVLGALVAGLYFGILAVLPLWKESRQKRLVWRAVRREQKEGSKT